MSAPKGKTVWPTENPRTDFCVLGTEEVEDRAALIRADLLPRIVRTRRAPGRVLWEFDNEPGMRAKLEEFVEFERRCCSGMTFDLGPATGDERLRLTIAGEGADRIAALADRTPLVTLDDP